MAAGDDPRPPENAATGQLLKEPSRRSTGRRRRAPAPTWLHLGSRLGAFSLLPFVSVLTPFLVLPAVARLDDRAGWAALGIGQAIGLTLSIVAMWGWYAAGPSRFTRLSEHEDRRRLYLESLRQRLVTLLVFGVPAITLAALLSPGGHVLFCVTIAIGIGGSALSPAWFYIAQGSAAKVALSDTLPKAVLTVGSVPIMLVTDSTWAYAGALVISAFVPPFLVGWRIAADGVRVVPGLSGVVRDLWDERAVAMSNVLNAAFTSTVVPIASIAHGDGISALVSADRLYRTGSSTTVALGNGLQSWVLDPWTRRRVGRSVLGHAVLGMLGAVLLVAVGPIVTAFLFGAPLRTDELSCVGYAIAFLAVSVSMPLTRNILIPSQRSGLTAIANVLAVVLGVPLMVALSALVGPGGAAVGMAVGEVVITVVLLRPALVEFRRLPA